MTLVPSSEERGLSGAQQAIHEALGYLALWCPHGHDSSRAGDYHSATVARGHLESALLALGGNPRRLKPAGLREDAT